MVKNVCGSFSPHRPQRIRKKANRGGKYQRLLPL
jgi:hypothetical protein